MIDIFDYPQTFSRDIIEGTFKRVFQKAGSYYQDIFLDTYGITKDDFEEYLEKIIIAQDNSKILKNISKKYFKDNKNLNNYVIAYLYYKLTNEYFCPSPLQMLFCNFIFNIKFLMIKIF